mmetsp:Transcript_5527/g.7790  ORF Transcript_5527/g.7790 Transcript_5527/m.7790 type:complete len:365 (-) Transcript_5527:4720-5814(-)
MWPRKYFRATPFVPGQDAPCDATIARFFWWEDDAWRLEPERLEVTRLQDQKITMLTYNVWFGMSHFDTRLKGLIKLLEKYNADFICLQEVVPSWARALSELDWIREKYATTDPHGEFILHYGVLVLVKRNFGRPIKALWLHAPTEMNRFPLVAQFLLPDLNQLVTVSTNHFESLDNKRLREVQVAIIGSALLGKHKLFRSAPALICGDFNFDSKCNYKNAPPPLENDCLARWWPHHIDIWPTLHPHDPGFTYDTFTNAHLKDKKPRRMRYDRIIYIPQSSKDDSNDTEILQLRPLSIEIIGRESCLFPDSPDFISEKSEKTPPAAGFFFTPPTTTSNHVPPSDHYGLFASFALDLSSSSAAVTN